MTIPHGGNIQSTARKLGCRVEELIDMSGNLTPMTIVPGLLEAIREHLHEVAFLPESGSETLRELFAASRGLLADQVLAGNGTTEFIHDLPRNIETARAVVVNPTYSDYSLASRWAGREVESFALPPEEDFRLDYDRLARTLRGNELVFLCNPNNPTAGVLDPAALHAFIATHPQSRFVVDETYLPFVGEKSLLLFPLPENLLVLRSFSKIYGIPGLRLGFLAGSAVLMQKMRARRRPWEVNRLAQVAGEFCLNRAGGYVEEVVRFVARERPLLAAGLAALPGVRLFPGAANFVLCRLEGEINAATLRDKLLARRIMIRNCASFPGLDDRYFRVCLKQPEQNKFFLETIAGILK